MVLAVKPDLSTVVCVRRPSATGDCVWRIPASVLPVGVDVDAWGAPTAREPTPLQGADGGDDCGGDAMSSSSLRTWPGGGKGRQGGTGGDKAATALAPLRAPPPPSPAAP